MKENSQFETLDDIFESGRNNVKQTFLRKSSFINNSSSQNDEPVERPDISWSIKFHVNEAIDFQAQQKVKFHQHENQVSQINRQHSMAFEDKEWFEPHEGNDFTLTTRIIVQPNPNDNGAT